MPREEVDSSGSAVAIGLVDVGPVALLTVRCVVDVTTVGSGLEFGNDIGDFAVVLRHGFGQIQRADAVVVLDGGVSAVVQQKLCDVDGQRGVVDRPPQCSITPTVGLV